MTHLVFSCKYPNLWIISLLFWQFILPQPVDPSISILRLKCGADSAVISTLFRFLKGLFVNDPIHVIKPELLLLLFKYYFTGLSRPKTVLVFLHRMRCFDLQPRKWVVHFSVMQADAPQRDSCGGVHYSYCWLEPVLYIGVHGREVKSFAFLKCNFNFQIALSTSS